MFRSVVLSGGGVLGLAFLGALHYHFTSGSLSFCTRWVGASVGGLIATLIVAGYSPVELLDKIMEKGLENLVSGHKLEETVSELLGLKGFQGDVTFQGLYDCTGKDLVLVATSLNSGKAVFLSQRTTPDLTLRDAVRATTAIPLLFESVLVNDETLVDGCLAQPFPVHAPVLGGTEERPMLGLRIRTAPALDTEPESAALQILINSLTNVDHIWREEFGQEVVLEIEGVGILDTSLEDTEIQDLVHYGYSTAREVDLTAARARGSRSCPPLSFV